VRGEKGKDPRAIRIFEGRGKGEVEVQGLRNGSLVINCPGKVDVVGVLLVKLCGCEAAPLASECLWWGATLFPIFISGNLLDR
jgi:hypothetical protein